jgi:hypothetical protein
VAVHLLLQSRSRGMMDGMMYEYDFGQQENGVEG